MRIVKNTDKSYPCTNCGGEGNIIREGEDPRLKCLTCKFMYDASDSLAAVNAGTVPDGPPQIDDPAPSTPVVRNPQEDTRSSTTRHIRVPRTPSYVVVTKDRMEYAFTTKKDMKKVVLQWTASGKKFDIFELLPKQVSAKVDIQ